MTLEPLPSGNAGSPKVSAPSRRRRSGPGGRQRHLHSRPSSKTSRPRPSWAAIGFAASAPCGHAPGPPSMTSTFIPCGLTRIPLEGYREQCSTRTVLGTRFAAKPIELDIPVMITGMSFGALSYNAKVALARAREAGRLDDHRRRRHARRPSARTRRCSSTRSLPSRYGINVASPAPGRRHRADHRPGSQAGHRRSAAGLQGFGRRSRGCAICPAGVDQRSPCRHPDFLGPDDMVLKIEELREATDWQVPIFVKLGASRVYDDVKLAAKAGADVVVIDGMEGGTGASPDLLQEHTGIPHPGRRLRGPRRSGGTAASSARSS